MPRQAYFTVATYIHRRNFSEDGGPDSGPPLFESIKSEILPLKRVMQNCRVQTAM